MYDKCMNKQIWILIFLAVIIIVLLTFFIFMPKPIERPPTQSPIEVFNPQPNEEVSSPLMISGIVGGGGWAGFEGQVGTVSLVFVGNGDSASKTTMASAPLTAITDWTKLPTSFSVTLPYVLLNDKGASANAEIIFKNENPSGDPAKDKTFILPIKIK
jgi:hypothetical protein